MEKKKLGSGVVILIIALIVVIIVLSAILIYKEVFAKDTIQKSELPNTNVSSVTSTANEIGTTNMSNVTSQEQNNLVADATVQKNGNVASKNIMINGIVKNVKITGSINGTNGNGAAAVYNINLKAEIEGKATENIEAFEMYDSEGNKLKVSQLSSIVQDITTMKSQENKDYILIKTVSEGPNNNIESYYIISEAGKLLGSFSYEDAGETIIVNQVPTNAVQYKENYFTEYKIMQDTDSSKMVLKEYKYTIKNDELAEELVKTYTTDEFQQVGKGV